MPGWIGSNWSIQPSSQFSLLLGAENIEVWLPDVVLVDVGAQLPLLPHDTCTGVAKDGTTDCGNTAQFHPSQKADRSSKAKSKHSTHEWEACHWHG